MAKQPNTGLADDLNAEGSAKDGLSVDDLNAGDNTQEKQPLSKTDDAESSVDDDGGDEKSEDTESQEYVVLKGNCIRHDGEMYRENMRIPVTGKDAERLLQSGVIADVDVLRKRVLASQPSVSVTTG
ncbi:hypothetical protein RZP48_02090 [Enterobacter asburiae]|jgi:TATA-binding protein-associated factor Taf7|uniref:Uncharacterized protein n=1 Tax=Enterobacter asburiae TaxID=61645 RepID=A0AAW8A406_ENTAS|nr:MULTISPECIES: hypothetical protein [Enterobacter cloacae complex]MCL8161666.1 hypothetical protein [Enterobacter asburiae]MCM7939353.1 hypothetical protein [Enterobacter asburiae]MDO7925092.1 hypothetical protein [Enterobacter asburiae]MDV0911592.1 hypothetical protein [Enterobacter asburiae]MDV0931854.1 hypothetical protein [Enterobacter asburiae]